MFRKQENLNLQIKTFNELETEYKELKNTNEQLQTWNNEKEKEQKEILNYAEAIILDNKRLSSNRHDLTIELSKQYEMLETFEKKITHYNNVIIPILNNPEKKSILIAICENYSSIYKKGIACKSRKTQVSNILEQLLRIDFDNKENTIEEEITKGFEIPMYGSEN